MILYEKKKNKFINGIELSSMNASSPYGRKVLFMPNGKAKWMWIDIANVKVKMYVNATQCEKSQACHLREKREKKPSKMAI